MSQLWSDNIDPSELGNGPGFFSRLRYYMIGPVALLGLCLSVWLVVIGVKGLLYVDASSHEIRVEATAEGGE